MLDELSDGWLRAKETERAAIEARRIIEDKLLSLIGIPETFDGTENVNTGVYKIKVVGRMTRNVDGDHLNEIAIKNGLELHLASLFRFMPEINMQAWAPADPSIATPLLDAITTTPGRAFFTIVKENKNG